MSSGKNRRPRARVWVIGLDGADWDLMGRFMEEGKLPVLRKIRDEGAWGVLASTEPPLSPAAWTTFATGKLPGKHGVLDHVFRKEGTYDFTFVNATVRGATPVWDAVGARGLKVGLINIPLTYPPAPVNGFLITGMYTPSDDHPFTYPPELGGELRARIGPYKVLGTRSKEDLDAALEGIMEGIEMRRKAALYLLGVHDPDLFIMVFSATDTAQHKFWKYMDPDHPQHREPVPPGFTEAIERVYCRVDESVGEILETAPEGTRIVVMSDHGASPLFKYLYLNNWLIREGFMAIKRTPLARVRHGLYRMGMTPFNLLDMASRMWPALTDRIVGRVRQEMSGGKNRFHDLFLSWRDIDWAATRAFSIGGNLGGVYVNLRGREPMGAVEPGASYERVRLEIMERLGRMRDPDTDERVVERAWRREDLYHGPFLERIPDVVFTTRKNRYMVFGVHEFASNAVMAPSRWFSGAHSPEGVLIMRGDGIRSGTPLTGARIEDLAPTICHMLGQPIPDDMDGRLLETAFEPDYLRKHPPRFSGSWEARKEEGVRLRPEEERSIRRRLEDLGYL